VEQRMFLFHSFTSITLDAIISLFSRLGLYSVLNPQMRNCRVREDSLMVIPTIGECSLNLRLSAGAYA